MLKMPKDSVDISPQSYLRDTLSYLRGTLSYLRDTLSSDKSMQPYSARKADSVLVGQGLDMQADLRATQSIIVQRPFL